MDEYNNSEKKDKYELYIIEKIGTIGTQNAFKESQLLNERIKQFEKSNKNNNSTNNNNFNTNDNSNNNSTDNNNNNNNNNININNDNSNNNSIDNNNFNNNNNTNVVNNKNNDKEQILLQQFNKLSKISKSLSKLNLDLNEIIDEFSEKKLNMLEKWLQTNEQSLLSLLNLEGNLFNNFSC